MRAKYLACNKMIKPISFIAFKLIFSQLELTISSTLITIYKLENFPIKTIVEAVQKLLYLMPSYVIKHNLFANKSVV